MIIQGLNYYGPQSCWLYLNTLENINVLFYFILLTGTGTITNVPKMTLREIFKQNDNFCKFISGINFRTTFCTVCNHDDPKCIEVSFVITKLMQFYPRSCRSHSFRLLSTYISILHQNYVMYLSVLQNSSLRNYLVLYLQQCHSSNKVRKKPINAKCDTRRLSTGVLHNVLNPSLLSFTHAKS